MNISGPTPLTPIPRTEDTGLALRLNQRFTAEIVQVSGERVLLAVDGVRVVARMTSMEQAAQLLERRVAQFVVKEVAGQVLSLQLIKPQGGGEGEPQSGGLPGSDLVSKLLNNMGLPADATNLVLARALLSQGLPVTPYLMEELRAVLVPGKQDAGNTGVNHPNAGAQAAVPTQAEAQAAAALKAAGLPLSPGAIALSQTQLQPLVESFTRLQARLQALAQTDLPPRLADQLQTVLSWLDSLQVNWSDPPEVLAQNLRHIFSTLGQSVEQELARLAGEGGGGLGDAANSSSPFTLAVLRNELAQHNPAHPLLKEIDQFLDALRYRQFENLPRDAFPPKEQWLDFDFPLFAPVKNNADALEGKRARLRVAYREKNGKRVMDVANTRLILQVELERGETLEVDLVICQRQVGARFQTSSIDLRDLLEERLPDFQSCLENLGYQLQAVGCNIGNLSMDLGMEKAAPWADFREINIVV